MAIDTTAPLYDSDGYQHHFVAGNGIEIVTKISGVFVVWNAKTGECLKVGSEGCVLGNTPLPPDELARQKPRAHGCLLSFMSKPQARPKP